MLAAERSAGVALDASMKKHGCEGIHPALKSRTDIAKNLIHGPHRKSYFELKLN